MLIKVLDLLHSSTKVLTDCDCAWSVAADRARSTVERGRIQEKHTFAFITQWHDPKQHTDEETYIVRAVGRSLQPKTHGELARSRAHALTGASLDRLPHGTHGSLVHSAHAATGVHAAACVFFLDEWCGARVALAAVNRG